MKSVAIDEADFLDPSYFAEQFEQIKYDLSDYQKSNIDDSKHFQFLILQFAKYAKHIIFKKRKAT